MATKFNSNKLKKQQMLSACNWNVDGIGIQCNESNSNYDKILDFDWFCTHLYVA